MTPLTPWKDLFHLGHQMADAINQPHVQRLLAHPDVAGEQILALGQLGPPTRDDLSLEAFMDVPKQLFQALHVGRLLGLERIHHALGFARCVNPALNTVTANELAQTKVRRNHPDGAHNTAVISVDLIGR